MGRESLKSRHFSRRLMPKDDKFSKKYFFPISHFYLPDVMVVDFSLKYAKFGHKMTLQSPPFYFQEVTETLMLYKFWHVQFSWYQKSITTITWAIILSTFMIIFIENRQTLLSIKRRNMLKYVFWATAKKGKLTYITCITYMTGHLLLFYIGQYYSTRISQYLKWCQYQGWSLYPFSV